VALAHVRLKHSAYLDMKRRATQTELEATTDKSHPPWLLELYRMIDRVGGGPASI
jgi:hypothetical protein